MFCLSKTFNLSDVLDVSCTYNIDNNIINLKKRLPIEFRHYLATK